MMRVEWTEYFDNEVLNPSVADYKVWSVKHEGEVIGVVRKLWDTCLVVACNDGKIREVYHGKVKIQKSTMEGSYVPRAVIPVRDSVPPQADEGTK